MSKKSAQQSVHLTLGILRTSQAVSHALSFFWLDGFAVPTPAQVTQTVGRWAYGVWREVKWCMSYDFGQKTFRIFCRLARIPIDLRRACSIY